VNKFIDPGFADRSALQLRPRPAFQSAPRTHFAGIRFSSPTALKEHIENALVRRARVDAHRITVETTAAGGRVILRGAVSSWAERHEAETTAWLAPGIESVDNQITISG
jgi:osmotically-inducible protein OsmY